jgi:hypothetical protein
VGNYVQRQVGFDAFQVVGSPTAVLQSGHVQDCESNQRSMHSTWKRCVHGSTRSVSPGSYSSRHTQQLDPELPPHDLTMRSYRSFFSWCHQTPPAQSYPRARKLDQISLIGTFMERTFAKACLIQNVAPGGADHHVQRRGVHARALCLALKLCNAPMSHLSSRAPPPSTAK